MKHENSYQGYKLYNEKADHQKLLAYILSTNNIYLSFLLRPETRYLLSACQHDTWAPSQCIIKKKTGGKEKL